MEVTIKVLEAHRIPNRQDKKRNYSQHIIISTLTVTNNNNNKKATRKKRQSHIEMQAHYNNI